MYKKWELLQERTIEKMRGGRGVTSLKEIFFQQDFGSSMTHFIFVTVPPGGSVGGHEHSGDEEIYYILEGRGRVQDDDQKYDVGPYDAILTNSGHRHGIENIGEKDLKMLAVIGKVV